MLYVESLDLLHDATVTTDPLPLVHPRLYAEMRDWGIEQQRLYWELWRQTKQS